MRYLCFLVLILVVVTMLCGCDPVRPYLGPESDLITTAIYSIPGVGSNETDNLQILEKDNYGRILYAVCMDNSLLIKDSWENCVVAILVMQKSEAGSVYFYAENNYLITVVSDYVDLKEISIGDFFHEEDILALKEQNDWNCPYQAENLAMVCFPVSVDKSKRPSDISDKIIDTKIGSNYRYAFFREDANGKNIYFVTHITKQSYKFYLIAFNPDGTLVDEHKSILQISQNKLEELPLVVQEFLNNNVWEK